MRARQILLPDAQPDALPDVEPDAKSADAQPDALPTRPVWWVPEVGLEWLVCRYVYYGVAAMEFAEWECLDVGSVRSGMRYVCYVRVLDAATQW